MTSAMRLGQRRCSSRWKRTGARTRRASRSFSGPQSNPVGRTVCPASPASSSQGARPRRRAIARHSSTTTAVSTSVRSWISSTTMRSKPSKPSGTAVVAQALDGPRRRGELGEDRSHGIRRQGARDLQQRPRRLRADPVVAAPQAGVGVVAQARDAARGRRSGLAGDRPAEEEGAHLGVQRVEPGLPRPGHVPAEPRDRGVEPFAAGRQRSVSGRRRRTPRRGTSRSRGPSPPRRPARTTRSAPRRGASGRSTR